LIIIIIIISIQPLGWFWQEPEPSQVTGMALARCILGKFLGVVAIVFPCF
jgi:fumarate reductase subunit D